MDIFISKNYKLLENLFNDIRSRSKSYYIQTILSESEQSSPREIIFDIGYQGSVSNINYFIKKPLDKIYFSDDGVKNQEIDNQFSTLTYTLLSEREVRKLLPFEELLSPLEGSCLGYDQNLVPILEKESYSHNMRDLYKIIHDTIITDTNDFVSFFKNYVKYLHSVDTNALFVFYKYSFIEKFRVPNLLNGVQFKNSFDNINRSLETKIFESVSFETVRFTFDNILLDNHHFTYKQFDLSNIFKKRRICIYIDLVDVKKLPNLIDMLQKLDFSYDLFINTNLDEYVIKKYFAFTNCFIVKKSSFQSLYDFIFNLKFFITGYDLLLFITTELDSPHYPDSEFNRNLSYICSPVALSQVNSIAKFSNTVMLSLPFSSSFKDFFQKRYPLLNDINTLNCINNIFTDMKKYYGNSTILDDYPVERTEYAKLFNESFWCVPSKLPSELFFILDYDSDELKTNQRLSVLIPVIINRVVSDGFNYFYTEM